MALCGMTWGAPYVGQVKRVSFEGYNLGGLCPRWVGSIAGPVAADRLAAVAAASCHRATRKACGRHSRQGDRVRATCSKRPAQRLPMVTPCCR